MKLVIHIFKIKKQMEKFIEVTLKEGYLASIAISKIVVVIKENDYTKVYCVGLFTNDRPLIFAVNMDYSDFMALVR